MVAPYLRRVRFDMFTSTCTVQHVGHRVPGPGAPVAPRCVIPPAARRRRKQLMEAQTGVAPSAARPPKPGEATSIAIAYETFGDPSDPAVLLVMGFGTQMLGWDADFCHLLAARGRYVIRYDNRDCGLSTKLDEHPLHLEDFTAAVTSGDFDRALAMAPYSLRDMARDGIAVLDWLDVARAHVVGSSMGGMIAQKMAIEFPDRVLTLTSMMSSTGEQEYGQSTPEARQVLFSGRPA